MKKIAFYNAKGGVGKSTLATTVSSGLALAEYNVLLIDLDPQNDCSLFLGVSDEEKETVKSFNDLIDYKANLEDCLIQARENLNLIYNSNYRDIERELHKNETNISNIVDELLNEVENYNFDYVFFDCSPSNTITNTAILHYIDGLIVPVKLKLASIKGISNIYNYLDELGLNEDLIKLIVPNQYDMRLKEEKDNLEKLKDLFDEEGLISNPIKRRTKISELANRGVTVIEYGDKAEEQFFPIIKEVVNIE